MRKLLVIILLASSIVKLSAQSPYYDALFLKNWATKRFSTIPTDTLKKISDILCNYDPPHCDTADALKIIDAFTTNNPFFKSYFLHGSGGMSGLNFSHIFKSLSSSVGGLDVTNFADGLAKFLVERTKEELNVAFFKRFRDFLDFYPEFKTLFPNTKIFVDNFNSWEYSSLLNTLREAFDKDIKGLLINFINLRNLNDSSCDIVCSDFKKNCEDCKKRVGQVRDFFTQTNSGIFLMSAAKIGGGIIQGDKIPDIIDAVTKPDFLLAYKDDAHPDLANDLKNALKFINIISLSLKSQSTERQYVSAEEFNSLKSDTVFSDLYLGLVYQQISNEDIQVGPKKITEIFRPANIHGVMQYLANANFHFKKLQESLDKLEDSKAENKPDLGSAYAFVFESTKQTLRALFEVNIINTSIQLPSVLTDIYNITAETLQIAHDISVRNYHAVVVGALKLLADATKNYPDMRQFSAAFLKWGSFAANVTLSKDPEEVKQAIRAIALPSGSATVKKHTQFNISVNSYVGLTYGHLSPAKDSFTTTDASGNITRVRLNEGNALAIYAPVGIAFNWGLGWEKRNAWSASAFISLIDIGAVVGYRFVEGSGKISDKFKIRLANIFAPGANLVIGLPNLPISIGGGAQWIPTLQRDPNSNEFYNIDYSGWRYQVFAAVDIPMFNLFTSRKSFLYAKK